WLMSFPERLPAAETAVRGALRGALQNMRGGGAGLAAGPDGMGLDGVAAFAEAYGRWPERYAERLDGAMRGLRIFIVKAGTGGALFRGLHAVFLHDASRLV